jgi:hypothetical protein
MSGATADAVMSNWHGRPYVRQRVVPLNPNTVNQQRVRESLARLPELWRSLESQIKTALDTYAISYRMSGYNWFCKQNRVDEETYDSAFITPPNIEIDPAATLTLTAQTGGNCKIDWTGGTVGANYKAYILMRRVDTGHEDARLTLLDHDATLFSAGTLTKAVGTSRTVRIYLIDEETTSHTFSIAKSAEVVMGA